MRCCSDPDSFGDVSDPDVVDYGGDCDGLAKLPLCVHIADTLDFRDVEIRTGTGRPLGRLSSGPAITLDGLGYTDTPPALRPIPPEKIAAARKALDAITARQKGLAGIEWPPMWIPSAVYSGYRIGPDGATRLLDTERGRRAAWELEGE